MTQSTYGSRKRKQRPSLREIERRVEAGLQALGSCSVLAFVTSGDGLGVALEFSTELGRLIDADALAAAVHEVLEASLFGRRPAQILLLEPGALPRSRSGRPQRAECARRWGRGELGLLGVYQGSVRVEPPVHAGAPSGFDVEATQRSLQASSLTEEALGAIWCEVLGVRSVPSDASFFALGGSSIDVVRVATLIEQRLGVWIDPTVLSHAASVQALARVIDSLPRAGKQSQPARIERLARERGWSLSPTQRRMRLAWQLDPASAAYNLCGALRMRGELDRSALQRTFDELLSRHEALRTHFPEDGGVPYQHILPPGVVPLRFEDWCSLPAVERDGRLSRLLEREAATPFDLEHGPLLRVTLARLARNEHVLVVSLHHAAADGASANVMLAELAELYSACCRSDAPALPPRPLDVVDYAAWQETQLESGLAELQLAYWQRQLGPEHPRLTLPFERSRSTGPSFLGAEQRILLDPALAEAVRASAREHAVSVFAVLLAGFDVLLSHSSGQQDLRVGIPVANRRHPQGHAFVGALVNTQVVRTHVREADSFASLLVAVQRAVLEAQAHQELPFERLVEVLQPERSPGQHPLFQVMHNHQRRELAALDRFADLAVDWIPIESRVSRFNLSLETAEDDRGGLSAAFVYATDAFDAEVIQRLADQYRRLLAACVSSPQLPLVVLDWLPQVERSLLSEWSTGPELELPPGAVHDWIARQAMALPDAVALRGEGHEVSYAELELRANRLGEDLRRRGVGQGHVVAIGGERSCETVIGVLGILKCGAAYVAFDPEAPEQRLVALFEQARAQLLVATSQAAADEWMRRLPQLEIATVPQGHSTREAPPAGSDPDAAGVAPGEAGTCRPAPHADSLAYVLFTSGSTGRPKPVGNTHGGIAARLAWMQHEYRLERCDTVLHKAPLSFDVSVWEMLWPLSVGASVVLAAPGEHRDPFALALRIQRHDVRVAHFVPSLLRELVAEEASRECSSLRLLFSGGEVLPRDLEQRVRERFRGARLDNRYGPTEAAINASVWTCTDADNGPVPIGRPLSHTVLRVLSPSLGLVPLGAPGELCIGGRGLARGYLNQPALTAERFVPDPFSDEPGQRLYRSGDWVCHTGDGALLYLGRKDEQVKVRGVRIELGELEAALGQLDGVEAGAAAVVPGAGGAVRLVGYVVLERPVDVEALQRALDARLPKSIVPSQLVVLEQLPRLSSGKLHRKALPEPEWLPRPHVPPRRELERRVAAIWQAVLEIERVGLSDDFFALGGHSLLATQVVARVRSTYGVELPLRELFEAPQLDGFVQRVERAIERGQLSRQPPIEAVDRSQPLPLSLSQERMWFLWALAPQSAAYNVGGAVHMSGRLHDVAFDKAMQAMLQRHEGLRTRFPSVDGTPRQAILAESGVCVERLDLSTLGALERQVEVERIAHLEAQRPFDLEHGPLIRLTLLALAPEQHVLLVTLHHIVAEGWAMDVFAEESAALYQAFSEGRPSPLRPLSVQYADFAVWQRRWLEGGEAERQLEYWRRALGTEHLVLQLPSDRPRPAVHSFRGDYHRFSLDAELSAQLRNLAREARATLSMALIAGVLAWLHRYTGQTDLRVGYPIANRTRPELERLIGAFLNTQVLRCEVTPHLSMFDLIERVRVASLDAQAHQDVPFHRIVEAVQPERSAAHLPLFQVMCNVQSWQFQQTRSVAGLTLRFVPNDARAAKCDLAVDVSDVEGQLEGVFTYSTDLFDRETVERMVEHFCTLLRSVVQNPDARIENASLLSGREQTQLLREWNETLEDYPSEQCLHQLLERQAERTPDAVAVVFEGARLSYAELNGRANQLARRLRSAGVGPDERVGIFVERSLEMVVGLLGISKAGGAYVPLDSEYPSARIDWMLADSAPRLVLSQERLVDRLPAASTTLCLDRDWPQVASLDSSNLPGSVAPANLAYVMYTSGSTGRPKGVACAHRGLVNFLSTMRERPGVCGSDRVLGLTSLSFDISGLELYLPLLVGGTVVLAPRAVSGDPKALTRLVELAGVTVLQATPASWRMLSEAEGFEQLRVKALCGGEALPIDLAERLVAVFGAAWNLYGPTETTVWSSRCQLSAGSHEPRLGSAVGNTQLYVLDGGLDPSPPGVVGELYIGGVGLARGYFNQGGLTAQRFLPDPFGAPGQRLYRSGDLARRTSSGALEYLGRADDQVKIRGHRIELGEVESRLLEHPRVRQAVVLARRDASGQQRLLAYVVASAAPVDEAPALLAQLREHMTRALPTHMLPSGWMLLDELPLTTSGKLDRKALPEPDGALLQRKYVAPRSEAERQLAEIWQGLLGVERVGVHDNFFRLGGHSLLAIQVASRVRQVWGVELDLRTIFEHLELEPLAQRVSELQDLVEHRSHPDLEKAARETLLPLSYAQQRQWVLWELDRGGSAYNIAAAARLSGRLQRGALERTIDSLVERHEALRTRIGITNGEPHQVVAEAGSVAIAWEDLSGLPEAEWQPSVLRRLSDAASRPFDLERGPLLRVTVLRISEQEHVLLLVQHHVVSDGWSVRVLIEEFVELYTANTENRAPALKPLPIQYADYAVWQRAWLESGELEWQLQYWKKQLGADHPVLELPGDRTRPPPRTALGARSSFELPAELTAALRSVGEGQGATLFVVLLAAWNVFLHRYTGQEDLRVGVPYANRTRETLEGLVGLFVNTQVLRTRLNAREPFLAVMARVREASLGAQAHADLPFERLVEALNPERSLSHHPLFQVMHNHEIRRWEALHELPGLKVEELVLPKETTQFDLVLNTVEVGDRLSGALTYSVDLFEAETVERMAAHFCRLLESIAQNPADLVGRLPLLGAPERVRLLRELNGPEQDCPRDRCLHDWIERQATQTPEAVAVVFQDERLSYAALSSRANQLARKLQAEGVGPDERVGIFVERSLELAVGVLGILKAGAAYVPLDPEYPSERLNWMLEDSAPRLVLTQQRLLEHLPLHARMATWCLDRDWAEVATNERSAPDDQATPENLAYVMYTSGSTGRPKGVACTHGGLLNRILCMQEEHRLEARDAVVQKAPLGFDVSVRELLWPLMVGARLVLLAPGVHRDPALMGETLRAAEVTVVHFAPTMMETFVQSGELQKCLSVRSVLCGGEALHADLGKRTLEATPGRLYNLYGPTEASIDVAEWKLGKEDRLTVPIGRAVANVQLRVLDGELEPVPQGVVGELYIGGVALARGYVRRGDLTSERFVPDAHGSEGGRLYRTGDLVRRRGDGALEYLGRADHQVKIRGHRIELGEIESRLSEHAGVREAVVLARGKAGEQRLVAYVVATDTDGAEASLVMSLREHAGKALPAYMLPSQWVVLSELPLTSNGKVDRKALPEPGGALLQREYEAPGSHVEEQLAKVWREVLRVERVGLQDNFFELGGDSIIALRVVSRAREAGLELGPQDIFRAQTLRTLAAAARVREEGGIRQESEADAGEVELTPIQRWFFELGLEERSHWNQAVLLGASGLDGEALRGALKGVQEHHAALRLRYRRGSSGQWEQHQAEGESEEVLWEVDLRAEEDVSAAIERESERAQRSLDIERGPLLRAAWFGLPGGEERLLLVVHHLVVDGVSWRVLLEDVTRAYEQQKCGSRVELGRKTQSYGRWSRALVEYAKSEELQGEVEYWRGVTSGSGFELPGSAARERNTVESARRVSVELSEEETRRLLSEAPKAYRTQVNDLLLTALSGELEEWSGEGGVLLELEGHGREEVTGEQDVSRTVGWFTSKYPVRLSTGGGGLGEQLKRVKEQLRGVPRRGLGYGVLKYLSGAELGEARPPVQFNYLGQFDEALPAGGLFRAATEPTGQARSRQGLREHELEVTGLVHGGRLRLQLTYSEHLHERTTVQTLLEGYRRRLSQLLEHCVSEAAGGLTPSDVPLAALSQAELDRLPVHSRQIAEVYPLTGMQEGLLYHGVLDRAAYVLQRVWEIEAELVVEALREAFQRVIDRHDILRTGFVWEGLRRAMQVVRRSAKLPLEERDWRGLAEPEQEAKVSRYLEEDRERGFELKEPPLTRLLVARTGERRWRLVWTSHHLVTDGWSSAQLLTELFGEYEAVQQGKGSTGRGAAQYGQYVEWLESRERGATEAYWRKELGDLESPTLLTRSVVSEAGGEGYGEQVLELSAEQSEELRSYAREQRVTVNTLLQGAVAIVLSRYTSQGDVAFGVTTSGRSGGVGTEALGVYINTLALRVKVEGHRRVGEWLRELQGRNAEMREHEHAPLFEVQRYASAVSSGGKLFDTLLVFENYPVEEALRSSAGRLGVSRVESRERTTYPVTLVVVPGERVLLRLAHERSQLGGAAAGRLLEHLIQVSRELSKRELVREVTLLSEGERGQLQVKWNETEEEYRNERLFELIEEQTKRTPEAVAVVFEGEVLSYGELNSRANQLARQLRQVGVGPDERVGIFVERSLEMVVGLLGILKAGGAYVPLDAEYPRERLEWMLEDSAPRLVLTQERLKERLPSGHRAVWCLDRDWSEVSQLAASDVCGGTEPEHLAYVIYTSGSTGRPKGVGVTQGGLSNYVQWALREYAVEGMSGSVLHSSLSFDLTVTSLWLPLCTGGRVDCVRTGVDAVSALLEGLSRVTGPQLLKLTPAHARVLSEGKGPPIRGTAVLGGEALTRECVSSLRELAPELRVINEYGPTEAVVGCCVHDATEVSAEQRSIPIGHAIANVRLHVLDDELELVPLGALGELYIGGAGLARGYVNRGDLTSERFVADPFGEAGERLYRTGDLVHRRADGELEYHGRRDHQVKVRGYRVELGEIESRLKGHAGVREAVVLARGEASGQQRLAAYVVAQEPWLERSSLLASLREHALKLLPAYMVPSQWQVLDELPLTSNGKLDRAALPEPEGAELRQAYVAPRTEVERKLAELWQEVLGVERVGLQDNFFVLGGDSILALRLASRAHKARFAVGLQDIFRAESLAALAARVDSSRVPHHSESDLENLWTDLNALVDRK